jgi:hypothetical protein
VSGTRITSVEMLPETNTEQARRTFERLTSPPPFDRKRLWLTFAEAAFRSYQPPPSLGVATFAELPETPPPPAVVVRACEVADAMLAEFDRRFGSSPKPLPPDPRPTTSPEMIRGG